VTAGAFHTFFYPTMELYGGQLLKKRSQTKFSRYSIPYTGYSSTVSRIQGAKFKIVANTA
jgi:hypothetical protein